MRPRDRIDPMHVIRLAERAAVATEAAGPRDDGAVAPGATAAAGAAHVGREITGAGEKTVSRREVPVAFSSDAATLDPTRAFNVPAQSIVRHLYEPLVYHDMRGNLRPVLAESWAWRNDSRILDLTLRRGVQFHGGEPLTARDVKYTFDRILSSGSTSPQKPTLFYVEDTEIIGERTIRIRSRVPARPLLPILSLYPLGILNAQWTTTHHDDVAVHANGTGPFRLVQYEPGRHAVLERNPRYWGTRAAIERLTVRVIPDAYARVRSLLGGEVMMVNDVRPDQIPAISGAPGLRMSEAVTARLIYGQINLTRPPFGDRRVRHALNYAVDKERIVRRVLRGHGQVANCPVAPSVRGHNPDMVPWPCDPARARSLLGEAGYSARSPLPVRLVGPAGRFALDERVGEAVAENLAEAGIRISYRAMGERDYVRTRADLAAWDVLLSGWCVHTLEADFLLSRNFYHEWVPVGYANQEVRRLLDQARAVDDGRQSVEIYRRAQALIWDDAPWIWLYYQPGLHAVSDRLTGFHAQADEFLLLHDAACDV